MSSKLILAFNINETSIPESIFIRPMTSFLSTPTIKTRGHNKPLFILYGYRHIIAMGILFTVIIHKRALSNNTCLQEKIWHVMSIKIIKGSTW